MLGGLKRPGNPSFGSSVRVRMEWLSAVVEDLTACSTCKVIAT